MLNVDSINEQSVSLASVTSGVTFVAGRAVRNSSTGITVPDSAAAVRILGLVKEHLISGVVDEISGQFGIAGSKMATVVLRGVVTVQQSSYAGTSYSVYDQAQTYAINDELYATPGSGILTNQAQAGAGPNGSTSIRVGRVLVVPVNPANGDPMKITVECA